MTDMALNFLAEFHFLRPWWLLVIPVFVALSWLNRRWAIAPGWHRFIAPELLEVMLVKREASSIFGPRFFAIPHILCWVLALAGPTWERHEGPLGDVAAPLVIALELDESMLKEDLRPTRLDHAKAKIADLLATRKGAQTALIAYAGSAHLVIPLTEDAEILQLYLSELTPSSMPLSGVNIPAAYDQASRLLNRTNNGGQVLFVGSERGDQWPLSTEGGPPALYWQITAEERHLPGAQLLTLDGADVSAIAAKVNRSLVANKEGDHYRPWHDAGYYLVFPVVLMALVFFRPGMVIQWR